MKKLDKIVLQNDNLHVLSESEMKAVTGGVSGSGSGFYVCHMGSGGVEFYAAIDCCEYYTDKNSCNSGSFTVGNKSGTCNWSPTGSPEQYPGCITKSIQ